MDDQVKKLIGQELVDAVNSRIESGGKIGDICKELNVAKSTYAYWRMKLTPPTKKKRESTSPPHHQVIEVPERRTDLTKVRRHLLAALQELESIGE